MGGIFTAILIPSHLELVPFREKSRLSYGQLFCFPYLEIAMHIQEQMDGIVGK
jgi:hypothetical protein